MLERLEDQACITSRTCTNIPSSVPHIAFAGLPVIFVHGCRQTDEVQVNVDSIGSRKSQPLTSRLVAGALAQRHWLLPCAEGLLGIHVLREGCAVVRDAMRLSASEWWTTIR